MRRAQIASDTEVLGRIDHVDQVVGDSAAIFRRGFGRADVHPPIDGDRIERQNFCADPLGQNHCDPALPRSRRTGHHDRLIDQRLEGAR
jgi:hypothetical protein